MRYCLAFLMSLLLTPVALASSQPDENLSARLLSQTGVDALLQQYPDMVKSGIVQRVKHVGVPDIIANQSVQLVDQSLNPGAMILELQTLLARRFSPQEMQQIVDWYQSPVGRRVVEAELMSVSRSEYHHLQETLTTLQARYQGSDRERLFPAFDRATYATDTMVDSTSAVQIAMAAALSTTVKGEGLPSFESMRATIESRRTALRGVVGQQVYLNYLFTYQDLSLADMENYIAFARSELGARFFETLSKGVYEVLTRRSSEMGGLQASL
ncbi:MAG: DUF2059 domain-containing protein [Hahellaceae bacterium]|jgi:hypothetical protein|nr:DUF2059 domain-containing protein [Hahellaceae bacterium]